MAYSNQNGQSGVSIILLTMRSMIINEIPRKKLKRSKWLIGVIIFGILVSCVYLFVAYKTTIISLLSFRNPKVVYDTFTVSFGSDISSDYQTVVKNDVKDMVFNGKPRFQFVDKDGDIQIESVKQDDNVEVFSDTLIPVGHMYSLKTSTDETDIKNMHVYVLSDAYSGYLKSQYGIDVQKVDSVDNLVAVMKVSDNNVGLIEYKDLDYRMKVLSVNGLYYLDNPEGGIHIRFYASSNNSAILDILKKNISVVGLELNKKNVLKLNMSGVVAISRGVASKMDSLGEFDYPAEYLGSFLADADLTHVSNEVSFVDGCTSYSGMRFCSRPAYIQTLEASGVDIVELTGNHNNDYGSTANANTINTYTSLGMKYFGGGLNKDDAAKILYEDVNGTKVAFLGYNYYDTMLKSGAIAWGTTAGANSYSESKLESDIATAKANADIVIVDFQFQECYCYPTSDVIYPLCYKPISSPDQKGVFRKAIDLGANIVIGTQAHQPQTYELYGDGVIFYGLGNLYFDQDNWIGTRQGLVLSLYFDNGKYVQTKITPIYMDSSFQPKLATKAQGDLLMQLLKTARN